MTTRTRTEIVSGIIPLRFGQSLTFPLVNDNDSHYKFYNILVKSVSQRRTINRPSMYIAVCTWGKIDTTGRSDTRKPLPRDENEMVEHVYNILSKKMKKGYRRPKATEYTTIKDNYRVHTMCLNSSGKLSKSNKKSTGKKKKDSNDKRFDDLII